LPTLLSSLLGLVLVAGPSPLQAGELVIEPNPDPESEALAIEAHQILTDHCAEVEGEDTTLAAQSVTVVSEVWARISAQLEKSGKDYLLYWRGVLGQCLNQDERALEDLTSFVEGLKDSELWASLVLDADNRMRRLERSAGQAGPTGDPQQVVGIILGASLSGAAIGSAIGSGLRWQESQDMASLLYVQKTDFDDLQAQILEGNTIARSSHALAGLAIGCGLGAAASFVIAALAQDKGSVASFVPPLLVPTRTGAVAVVRGQW